MLQPWGFCATPESDVDLVGDLGRDLVDRQGRDQADDGLGNPAPDRDQVGASERREVREPEKSTPELLQHSGIPHGVEGARMHPQIERLHGPQHTAVPPEDGRRLGIGAFSRGVEFGRHG